MKDDELLAAGVTPKRTHLLESGRPLSRLTLFERHCFHQLIFYLPVRIAISPLGPPVRDRNSLVQQRRCFPVGTDRLRDGRDLFAAKVTLCRLNRGVAQQKLNLLDLTAARMAQLRAGPAAELTPDFLGESRSEFVAKLAYQHWLERGMPAGSPEVDWFAAERAVYDSLVASGLLSRSGTDLQAIAQQIYH
jgi:hypothetical protein